MLALEREVWGFLAFSLVLLAPPMLSQLHPLASTSGFLLTGRRAGFRVRFNGGADCVDHLLLCGGAIQLANHGYRVRGPQSRFVCSWGWLALPVHFEHC